ncbi:hypothetical protein O997_03605 [Anaplasma phagocytophilum str. MRK]|nr:hypothetical protein O997_03605 [Anaplasma phagocytophilum str. MRK]
MGMKHNFLLITHSFFCCIIIICCALFTSLKSVILGKASNRYREDLPSNFKMSCTIKEAHARDYKED